MRPAALSCLLQARLSQRPPHCPAPSCCLPLLLSACSCCPALFAHSASPPTLHRSHIHPHNMPAPPPLPAPVSRAVCPVSGTSFVVASQYNVGADVSGVGRLLRTMASLRCPCLVQACLQHPEQPACCRPPPLPHQIVILCTVAGTVILIPIVLAALNLPLVCELWGPKGSNGSPACWKKRKNNNKNPHYIVCSVVCSTYHTPYHTHPRAQGASTTILLRTCHSPDCLPFPPSPPIPLLHSMMVVERVG